MNILYASDDNFAWIMGISMLSLFENNKGSKDINVYLLADNIHEDNLKKLESIANEYQRNLFVLDSNKIEISDSLCVGRWPKAAITRVFAHALLPKDMDTILYLDCDIIVNDDISELYNHPLENKAFWAVKDCVSKAYKKKIDIDDIYINTGVLLMNLNYFRSCNITERLNDFVNKYSKVIIYPDQEFLNSMFKGDIGVLDLVYNLMVQTSQYSFNELKLIRHPDAFYTKKEIENAKQNPKLIHYTTCLLNVRPWYAYSNLNNVDTFDKYMEMSPWSHVEKKEMDFSDMKFKTIKMFMSIPKPFSYMLLGILHAYLRPWCAIVELRLSRMFSNS